MLDWVNADFQDYASRFIAGVAAAAQDAKRRMSTTGGCIAQEGERLLAAAPQNNHVVALHEGGGARCRKELAARISYWLHAGCDIALIIGGPDGLAGVDEQWSLSRVILRHTLVRVIVAEQLY